MANTKICRVCNIDKNLTQFHKSNARKSGIDSMCKKCDKAKSLLRRVKKCSSCRAEKAKTQFSKNKYKPDGLATECKKCCNSGSSKAYAQKLEQNRVQDKQIIKNAKAEQQRQRAIKIMSKPINPKYTQIYYMSIHKPRSESNMDSPIQMRDNGGW